MRALVHVVVARVRFVVKWLEEWKMNNGFVEQKSTVERKGNKNSISIMYQERKLLREDLQESHSTLKEFCHKKSFWLKSWIKKLEWSRLTKEDIMNANQKSYKNMRHELILLEGMLMSGLQHILIRNACNKTYKSKSIRIGGSSQDW